MAATATRGDRAARMNGKESKPFSCRPTPEELARDLAPPDPSSGCDDEQGGNRATMCSGLRLALDAEQPAEPDDRRNSIRLENEPFALDGSCCQSGPWRR